MPLEEAEANLQKFKSIVREAKNRWAACTYETENRIHMSYFFRGMVEKLVHEFQHHNKTRKV